MQGLLTNGKLTAPGLRKERSAGKAAPLQNGGAAAPASADPAAEQADRFKEQGNAAFKAGDYDGAVAAYGAAIQISPRNPVLYSNRAMASLKVNGFLGLAERIFAQSGSYLSCDFCIFTYYLVSETHWCIRKMI